MKTKLRLGGIYTFDNKVIAQCTAVDSNGTSGEFINEMLLYFSDEKPSDVINPDTKQIREATLPERRFFFDTLTNKYGFENRHYNNSNATLAGTLVKGNGDILAVLCTDMEPTGKPDRTINFMLAYSLKEKKMGESGDVGRITEIYRPTKEEEQEFWEYWSSFANGE